MSLSSVGSSNPYAYLQWLLQSDTTDASNQSPPSDPLQSLYGAFSGDPLLSSGADGSGQGNGPPFSPDVLAALFSAQSDQSPPISPRVQALFGKFDSNGDGQISQSEFENAMGSNTDPSKVDALFSKIDANGDGSISQNELQSALQQAHGGHHHHHHHDASAANSQGSDPLQSLLSSASADGATSQSTSNADGSTTTTITYPDGTKIDMTTPAASSDAGSTAAPSGSIALNFSRLLQQLISLQAQLVAPTTNLTV
jgi:EF hand